MERYLSSLFLFINLAFVAICVEFNTQYTGVTFSPYVKKADGDVLIPSFGSYTKDDIKTMLEVVSTKFTRVLTDTLGASRDRYNNPYERSDTIARTAEVAARYWSERPDKFLTVYVGISESDWKNNKEAVTSIASTLSSTVSNIYSKRILGGFVLTLTDTYNYENLREAYSLASSLRSRTGIKVGIKLRCDIDISTDNYGRRDYNYRQIVDQRRNIISQSDFIVCMIDPEFGDADAKNSAKSVFTKLVHHQFELNRIQRPLEVMAETFWPSDGNETWQNINNFKDYWMEIDRLATANQVQVWLREAFDNPWRQGKASYNEHAGWWKLIQNDLIRSSAGYLEKITEMEDVNMENRASYGDTCNKTMRCNSRASLVCENGTCQCMKPNEMTFDNTLAKCVVLAGERCSYTAIEILTDETKEKRYSERLTCVQNATCKGDGYCGCRSDSFETAEGFCELKKGYQENCTRNEECQETENLICVSGNCMCNATEAVYHTELSVCVGKVGASRKYGLCVSHAEFHCILPEIDCACGCSTGYKASTDGLCYANYDTSCNPVTSPCLENYSCKNGKCACHFPTHQVYDGLRCVSSVNGPCLEIVRGKAFQYDCVDDAECRNDRGINECLCINGYIKSVGGTCKKAFGSRCSRDYECDRVLRANLSCLEGICSCGDFQIYDEQFHQCVGLVGAKCTNTSDCVSNATCEENRDKSEGGSCRCVPGMEVNVERKCIFNGSMISRNETEIEYAADEAIEADESKLQNSF